MLTGMSDADVKLYRLYPCECCSRSHENHTSMAAADDSHASTCCSVTIMKMGYIAEPYVSIHGWNMERVFLAVMFDDYISESSLQATRGALAECLLLQP